MKIVYIAHPISGDVEKNLAHLRLVLRVINIGYSEIVPSAPYYGDVVSMNDNDVLERKRVIKNNLALIHSGIYQQLWLTGDKISFGMQEEIKLFVLLGIPVINFIGKF